MSAQYYYLGLDHSVHGPFGLEDMWAMVNRGKLNAKSAVCRAGSQDWVALSSYPELLPSKSKPSGQKKVPTGCGVGCLAVIVLFFVFFGVEKCSTPIETAAVPVQEEPPLPTPPLDPAELIPISDARNGTVVYRDGKRLGVITGLAYQKSWWYADHREETFVCVKLDEDGSEDMTEFNVFQRLYRRRRDGK